MTTEEKTAYLATEVMGWEDIEVIWTHCKGVYWFHGYREWSDVEKEKWGRMSKEDCPGRSVLYENQSAFSPATDLNHQQMVLEKLAGDKEILERLLCGVIRNTWGRDKLAADWWNDPAEDIIEATLNTLKCGAATALLLPTLIRFNLIYDAVKGVRDDGNT